MTLRDEVVRHPAHFAAYASRGEWVFHDAPHLGLISNALQDIALRRKDRLLIQAPPRHGKTELVSRYFPAWFMGAAKRERIILTSYEAEFAATHGQKARDILEEYGDPIFGVSVSQKSKARHHWALAGFPGEMVTAGVGGPLTGKGADILIIDDPVKNAEEALSKTYRDKAWDWYLSTAKTRLQPQGGIILIQTRWHEDDLAGRILAAEGDVRDGGRWHVLSFPALCEDPGEDLLGREEGEALWPAMWPASYIEEIRDEGDEYWFAAMYQQRPRVREGAFFKEEWFKYFYRSFEGNDNDIFYLDDPEIPQRVKLSECRTFFTMDLAASRSQRADYTVIAVWRATPAGDLILDGIHRGRWTGPEQLEKAKRLTFRYQPTAIYVEKRAYQLTYVQHARAAGLPIIDIDPKGDKQAKAIPAAERMRAGKIYIPAGDEQWVSEFKEELLGFPTARHDDQVDVLSFAAEQQSLMMPYYDPEGYTGLPNRDFEVFGGRFDPFGDFDGKNLF